jgi:hypothetical protein
MPIDLVNVLKSQDEGYLRITKTANLKVGIELFFIWYFSNSAMQRVDFIKEELSRIVGAPRDNAELGLDLDIEETRILQQVGLLAAPSRNSKRNFKHIVFVEDESAGSFLFYVVSRACLTFVAAEHYIPPENRLFSNHLAEDMEEDDLGWKASLSPRKSAKAKSKGDKTWDAKDMHSSQSTVLKVVQDPYLQYENISYIIYRSCCRSWKRVYKETLTYVTHFAN